MTDDIVTRLRDIPEKRQDVSFGIWSTVINPYFEQLQEAADEIERLRAEVERLTQSKSVNLYEESLALTLTDIATWDDLQEGGAR